MTVSVTSAYTLSGVMIDTATINDLLLGQVSDWNLDENISEISDITGGYVDRTFAARGQTKPLLNFSSSQIKDILDNIGINGLPISGGDGVQVWMQKYLDGSTRDTGNVHTRLAIKKGILVPMGVTASNNARATCNLQCHAVWDGTNDIVTRTNNVAFHAAAYDTAGWVCGPVVINGTTVSGVQSINVNFGLEVMVLDGSGEEFPTFSALVTRQPSISITAYDMDILGTIGMLGTCTSSITKCNVYLRKLSECAGGRVANNVAEHILFQSSDGLVTFNSINAGKVNTLQINISPTWDGTNDTILIDTTSVIA